MCNITTKRISFCDTHNTQDLGKGYDNPFLAYLDLDYHHKNLIQQLFNTFSQDLNIHTHSVA